ncbi:MAG: flagellar assembly peptidoglycan hydrolase FlgJ [Pseudomonadota bacterium]
MPGIVDFSQFAALRAASTDTQTDRSQATLAKVATQFEALFVQQMLKSMRDASFGDPLFPESGGQKLYRDLFDQQIASDMASQRSLGLADLIVRQLRGPEHTDSERHIPKTLPDSGAATRTVAPNRHQPVSLNAKLETRLPSLPVAVPIESQPSATTTAPKSNVTQAQGWRDPTHFVESVMPFAQQAARALGVSPLAVMAQAALETGWGQSVDAVESRNLFGIKAGGSWQGAAADRRTLEFRDGVMQRERARFRSYGSINQSVQDYVYLLRTNSRYSAVLEAGDDIGRFADALQASGYATDPNYAAKIRRVANSTTMRDAVSSLKQTL